MSFFNPMDLNRDGQVDYTDYMIYSTYIAPSGSEEEENDSDGEENQ